MMKCAGVIWRMRRISHRKRKKEAGIEKEFLNDELDVCIAELKEYILHEMRKRI